MRTNRGKRMKQIMIFGTSVSADKIYCNIKKDAVEIVAFLDNDSKKQGKLFHGVKIVSPAEGVKLEFDYIVIASGKYDMMGRQLLELGVDERKIISYFAFHHADYNDFREIFYMEGMIYDEMFLKIEHIQKYLFNMQYEIADSIRRKRIQVPIIKTIDETIDDIIVKRLSISRYGDGEFDQIDGRREGYQEPDNRLSERLKEILIKPVEGHEVGLADIYGDLSHLDDKYADYFRNVLMKYRQDHYKYMDMSRTYYNAFISRIYSEMRNKSLAGHWFFKIKGIWNNRNVVIVEGDKTRFGVGNDLLDGAISVKRILCPAKGAFEKYDEILDACVSMQKQDLFLLALGPTATVLAYDLAVQGYQAVDIGHLDIEYEWYLRGIKEYKIAIEGKYTSEVVGGDVVKDVYDTSYETQIVERIQCEE